MRLTNLKSLLFILIIGTSLSSSLSAQKIYFWLDAGLKISGGTGLLMNTQVLEDRGITTEFGSTYGVGGKFGFNFGEFHAITIDAMYSSAAQTNRFRDESIDSKKISFNAIDLYGLYRYNRNLNYVELGVKYSLYQRFFQTVDGSSSMLVDELYSPNMLSPVLGFGYYMFNADAFTANLGFRISYGINDLLSDQGQATAAYYSPVEYTAYSSTHPAFVELVLELNFGLGQYAKSVCGKRASFMGM